MVERKYNKNIIVKAKELRNNMTLQENKLWYAFLRKYPTKFQRQKVIDSYICDFYCAKANLGIEIDGHQHYTKEGREYDATRERVLKSYKLHIIRFTNDEINKNFYNICKMIDLEILKNVS